MALASSKANDFVEYHDRIQCRDGMQPIFVCFAYDKINGFKVIFIS